ncbi:hypothetical protein C7974DRAFT_94997 [Boeremia exigua]|uniref:uncharacterized protein n=1 Tax=Boeremia exigua TaxID=749465 RepID=UPI001E8D0050|nr:uncharacterized protein C7974DRAFT_94997 [Boeremia exigua]KAH6642090.1 hypothetical protein C7974DRAFT_94997 [Boeremia exigua]
MGLPKLWDTIHKFEEVKPVAQLAEEHYKRYGRPLRIAVDEADWRFNNLTVPQAYAIRTSSNEPAFQGIEKAIFYRICKLLTLNIQLIFVFDGPGVPAKRGRHGGRKIDYDQVRLLKQLLRCFGIPYQEAPAEAEAECARLQILGRVDAVWSQDSDCLMFGCSLWLHDDRRAKEAGNKDRGKENTKKHEKYVRVVRAKDMEDRLKLDREGLVLFAMLAGGDYHEAGLPGCGAETALSAVKEGSLAHSLCLCRNQKDCTDWSFRLAAFLSSRPRARHLTVPARFPDFKILQKYYRPKVTDDELLMAKKSLNLDIPRPIDELNLLEVTSSRFNIWGRLYMNWVGPVLLTQSLVQRESSCPKEVVHDIKLTKQRASQSEEVMALRSLERKITFSPFGVTTLKRQDLEGGEREGMWDGKRDVPFDPNHRVECDYFPAFWLQRVLPSEALDPPPAAAKHRSSKRKEQLDVDNFDDGALVPTQKRQRIQEGRQAVEATRVAQTSEGAGQRPRQAAFATSSPQTETAQFKSKRVNKLHHSTTSMLHTQQQGTGKSLDVIDLSNLNDDDDDMVLRVPPARHLKKSASLRESLGVTVSNIVDLGSPESSENESDDLARALRLSMQSPHLGHKSPVERTTPGMSSKPYTPQISRQRLDLDWAEPIASHAAQDKASVALVKHSAVASEADKIRAARLYHFSSSPRRDMPKKAEAQPADMAVADYIDLTGD